LKFKTEGFRSISKMFLRKSEALLENSSVNLYADANFLGLGQSEKNAKLDEVWNENRIMQLENPDRDG
jgi:hypothetical protein